MNGGSTKKPLDKRALSFACAIGCLLFASLTVSVLARDIIERSFPDYAQPFTSWLPHSTPASIAIMALFGALAAVGFYLLFTRFAQIDARLSRIDPPKALPLAFTKRDIAKAGIAVFVAWLPITAIMYPTGLTADTFNQLYQYQAAAPTFYPTLGTTIDAEFIDHHPVFDTLLYGVFWQIGDALGSQNAGIFALAVLQSAVLAAEMGLLTCYLAKLEVPYALRAAALAFIALFPFFGHYACTVLKDSTYLTVFVPWMLIWVEFARTRGEAFSDKRLVAAFFVLGGFCILTKKLGVFVLAASLIVLLAAYRQQCKRILAGSLATLLVFSALFPLFVYPAVGGVAPGGRQEILGPAIQQVCTLLREDPEALTNEELADVNEVFDIDKALSGYEPFRSDPAKSSFKSGASNEQVVRFMQIWAAQGLRHPVSYLTSIAETSGMLYVPFLKMTYYSGDDLSGRARNYARLNPDFKVDVSQPEPLVELNDYLQFDSIESKVSDLPIVSLFFTEGFYGGWIPLIALGVVLYARRSGRFDAVGLAPLLVTVLFLLVSPVASPRYVLPLLFCTPLMLGWAWRTLK